MKNLVTIFTPTYNRGYTLSKLYNSLLDQTNKNFTWLIVDDGSTDNTKELVDKWIEEDKIKIEYIKQENQGKHIAHNTGVDNCKTELFFCIDSDDYLLENAVEDILKCRDKISGNNVSGIVSLKITKSGQAVGTEMPHGIEYGSLSDLYEKYRFKGDTALVFKTSILKKYKFPKIDGEKFVGEEYIYCQIDEKYKLYVSPYKYYVCEYLEDGYTTNMFKIIANNPKGYMELKNVKLRTSNRFNIKYKSASLYIVGCWLSKEKNIIKNSYNKFITIIAYPLALAVYMIRFRKIKNNGDI